MDFTEVRTPVKCKMSVVCEYSVSGTPADIVKAVSQLQYMNMWPKKSSKILTRWNVSCSL